MTQNKDINNITHDDDTVIKETKTVVEDDQGNVEIIEETTVTKSVESENIDATIVNDEKQKTITDEIATEDVDELMEKYDLDTSRLRKLSGKIGIIVSVIAILMSVFHLWTAWQGTLLAMKQRSLHMIFAFTIGFLLYPARSKSKNKNKVQILDWVFVAISLIVWGYIFFNVEAIALKGGRMSQQDMILGVAAVLITLEVTRRVVGPELPIVTIVFLIYAYFGRNMPGILAHRGFSIQRIVDRKSVV